MMSSAVTPVILGLLSLGPRSGYEIKAAVDRSTRFFWAASYGQIYPELRRLEGAGMIEGRDAPTGGRRKRVYRLTSAGRAALEEWLLGEEFTIELRDESLLRLFFADTLPRDEALGLLRGRREGYRQLLEYLRSLERLPGPSDPPFVDLVFRWAVDYCEWGIDWCERQERRLRRAA
jgi:DNA-binding PadR family transcriptional regulator